MPCQNCGSSGEPLAFRYFKRVAAFLIVDRIYAIAGYFCPACRRRLAFKHLFLTVLLGWWGILALYFRNPLAVAVNLWGLLAAPLRAASYGAIRADDLARDASQEDEFDAAEAHWWSPGDLSDAEISLVASRVDYYAALGVHPAAAPEVVKAAHRALVKKHHPDTRSDASSHETMVDVNSAYQVLGNARLRAAYDTVRAHAD